MSGILFLLGTSAIIPSNRTTVWQPGVTNNSIPSSGNAGNTVPSVIGAGYGIPTTRTQSGSTISPRGSGLDDTAAINSALAAASPGTYVKLSTGVFNINGGGIFLYQSGVTLLGSGPGKGLSTGINAVNAPVGSATFVVDATATQLVKQDRATNSAPIVSIGLPTQAYAGSTLLASNAAQGSYSTIVTSPSGLSVGQIVLVDANTDFDSNVFFNTNDDPAGAEVIASVSGTVLTVTAMANGGTINAGNVMALAWTTTGGGSNNNYVAIVSAGTGTGGVGTYNLASTPYGAPYSSQLMGIGYPTRRYYGRQGRSLSQMMEIASIVGNTVTFTTPFHYTYSTANNAQLTQFSYNVGSSVPSGMGVESLMLFGGTNDNIFMGLASYSWIKNVDAAYAGLGGIAMYSCFRCELRDSFIHELQNPNPGGGGYLLDIAVATSDSLIENNISWNGNKNIVMRGTGGGNVVAYNYFDDAYGSTYPQAPEDGLNAGHATTPNMELLEGNYSFQGSGDSFHGASINITFFRNHISTLRVAAPPLNTYTQGGNNYGDYVGRAGFNIQAGSYYNNFVGNVIGFTAGQPPSATSIAEGGTSNMSLLTGQTSIVFENLSSAPSNSTVCMWDIGAIQKAIPSWDSTAYTTLLRDGNWDYYTGTQTWLGLGGTQSSPLGIPKSIPNSLYLTSKPSFFGSNAWPWVNPSTGAVSTLPAKARFIAGQAGGSYN